MKKIITDTNVWYSITDEDIHEIEIEKEYILTVPVVVLNELYTSPNICIANETFKDLKILNVHSNVVSPIDSNTEIKATSFITVKGNYEFVDTLSESFVVKNIVTEIDGYDSTNLLRTLYLSEKAKSQTSSENERIIEEYNKLLSVNPNFLQQTEDVNKMKQNIKALNKNSDKELKFINEGLIKQKLDIKSIFNF